MNGNLFPVRLGYFKVNEILAQKMILHVWMKKNEVTEILKIWLMIIRQWENEKF